MPSRGSPSYRRPVMAMIGVWVVDSLEEERNRSRGLGVAIHDAASGSPEGLTAYGGPIACGRRTSKCRWRYVRSTDHVDHVTQLLDIRQAQRLVEWSQEEPRPPATLVHPLGGWRR